MNRAITNIKSFAILSGLIVALSACSLCPCMQNDKINSLPKNLANLKNEWVDLAAGKQLTIAVTLSALLPKPEDMNKYLASNIIPYRVTAMLYEIKKDADGTEVKRQVTGGMAQLLVYDHDGKSVLNETLPLVGLCDT
jgi:hypothetical protein